MWFFPRSHCEQEAKLGSGPLPVWPQSSGSPFQILLTLFHLSNESWYTFKWLVAAQSLPTVGWTITQQQWSGPQENTPTAPAKRIALLLTKAHPNQLHFGSISISSCQNHWAYYSHNTLCSFTPPCLCPQCPLPVMPSLYPFSPAGTSCFILQVFSAYHFLLDFSNNTPMLASPTAICAPLYYKTYCNAFYCLFACFPHLTLGSLGERPASF